MTDFATALLFLPRGALGPVSGPVSATQATRPGNRNTPAIAFPAERLAEFRVLRYNAPASTACMAVGVDDQNSIPHEQER
jgi:hypothetical protein